MITLEKQSIKDELGKYNLTPPSKKDEDWLYYNIDKLLDENISETENIENEQVSTPEGNHLVFNNGRLVQKKLSNQIEISNASNTTNTDKGFIELAKRSPDTIHLKLKNSNETISMMYNSTSGINSTNISIEIDGGELIIERHFSTHNNSLSNNYLNIQATNNANVIINEINNENTGSTLDFVDTTLDTNCHLVGLNQSYLSHNSRFQNRVYMNGINATARLNGLCINETEKECFYNTHVFHNKGENESHQLFKSINKDKSLFEYNGKVSVKKDAQQINSYQLNQNILLDDYATIHSRPQLFIDADDVKCSHGSTTGDLNKEELFYLMSRGLDETISKKMVLRAFVDDVFQHKKLAKYNQLIGTFLNNIL
ncbi:hypothetical protein DID73_01585 [Candidatus Marinamargulisbacteria bacterium SCGC AG-343-K17]|nr:hypothetical protein DID73_01585 [Candidatus Marinamargulisbacteria bacterium SCGC AG-343-K17]